MIVIKRDGRETKFERAKIYAAIKAAFDEVEKIQKKHLSSFRQDLQIDIEREIGRFRLRRFRTTSKPS